MQLDFDLAGNRLYGPWGEHRFSHRWEATLLALLLIEGLYPRELHIETLHRMLARKGQGQPLNRAQMQRLLGSLRDFASRQPEPPYRIESAPRKWTVGPWRILPAEQLSWSCHSNDFVTPMGAAPEPPVPQQWNWPRLTANASAYPLRQLLVRLLLSDGFAVKGQWQQAHDVLAQWLQRQGLQLAPPAQALMGLRQSRCLRRLGEFDQALQHIHTAQALCDEPGLQAWCEMLKLRLDYERAPSVNHVHLWYLSPRPPEAVMAGPSTAALAEWHNLRALLLRRQVEAHLNAHAARQGADSSLPGQAAACHAQALRHLETAIYYALQAQDWTSLQSYVANLGFHLHTWGRLTHWKRGITPATVLAWQQLELAYQDKFSVGHDSIWDGIYIAEFWLDYPNALRRAGRARHQALEISGHMPSDLAFYQHLCERAAAIADLRQQVIAWTLTMRFAAEHLHGTRCQQTTALAREHLLSLLAALPADWRASLRAEGYAQWWPVPARKPRKTRRARTRTRPRAKRRKPAIRATSKKLAINRKNRVRVKR